MNKNIYKEIFYDDKTQEYAKKICELASECWNLKLSDSTGFSISQMLNEDIILTDKSGTGFRRNKITINDLILIDLEGNLLFQPNEDNPRKAPVNVVIHLEGYKKSDAKACIHWHDPFTNAFSCCGQTIKPLTLQSKLIGDVPCVIVDDRKEKAEKIKKNISIEVPNGLHSREDVYYVMKQVGEQTGAVLQKRNEEFAKHGIVLTHYEHGLFAFGRDVEEAFENGYRAYRNAQTIIFSKILGN